MREDTHLPALPPHRSGGARFDWIDAEFEEIEDDTIVGNRSGHALPGHSNALTYPLRYGRNGGLIRVFRLGTLIDETV